MIKRPSAQTLKRYGLSLTEWELLLAGQSFKCSVCSRGTSQLVTRFVIDHEHVKGWRRMPAQERKRFVRGLLCSRCNWRFLPRGMTSYVARNIADYLIEYEARK